MTRAQFLRELRSGLAGLPRQTIDELLADYEQHFEQAAAEGRDDAETVRQLGEPERLARDIRADSVLSTWEKAPAFGGVFRTIAVLTGLGAADAVLFIPALIVAILLLAILAFVGLAMLFAGIGLIAFAVWNGLASGMLAALLGSIGLVAGAVAIGGVTAIAGKFLIDGLVWYARQHGRALKRTV